VRGPHSRLTSSPTQAEIFSAPEKRGFRAPRSLAGRDWGLSTTSLATESERTHPAASSVAPPRLARAWRQLDHAASCRCSLGGASGRGVKSGARKHLQANAQFGIPRRAHAVRTEHGDALVISDGEGASRPGSARRTALSRPASECGIVPHATESFTGARTGASAAPRSEEYGKQRSGAVIAPSHVILDPRDFRQF
jgi:hypothetical protein